LSDINYLQRLTIQLATGVGKLPESFRQRHASYLLAAQRDDGGFAGRMGDSDLYYTGFALRGLSILDRLQGEVASRAADFLRQRLHSRETIIDFLSLIYGGVLLENSAGIDIFADAPTNWRESVVATLNQLRRDDGGFAKSPEGSASSTYHTFLVLICFQLLQQQMPDPDLIVRFLKSRQAPDGGFHEIRVSKRAGTNPTAAAIASLAALDQIDSPTRETTIDFLCDMQTDEGGLRANDRIPIADILSTFTGMVTLIDLSAIHELDLLPLKVYCDSLQLESGGFHAAVWDDAHDVEYTFYGIGAHAILANLDTSKESE
jgi:geranylgeranyl transferase type-2 subunit beta